MKVLIDNLFIIGMLGVGIFICCIIIWDGTRVTKKQREEDITREVGEMCRRANINFFFATDSTVDYCNRHSGGELVDTIVDLYYDLENDEES